MARPIPPVVHGIAFFLAFLASSLYPLYGDHSTNLLGGGILLLYVGAKTFLREPLHRLQEWLGPRERTKNLLLLVTSMVFVLGTLEGLGQIVTRAGWVEQHNTIRTLLPGGVADFRKFHITADEFRVPDPVLLWRPVDTWPYNEQHMKGPVAEIPKPEGLVRILCYGDSNTDGPNEGTWPERLQSVLTDTFPDSRYEVINAGVAGYSSHQGLLRMRQTLATFDPDLIFVSFGWNDAGAASTEPDKDYRLPSAPRVALERWLLNYRFYRVLLTLRQVKEEDRPADLEFSPRVALGDYRQNLEAFSQEARKRGVVTVFLTRPYATPRAAMEATQRDMRGRVPSYNDAVRRYGEETGTLVVDVQQRFAAETADVDELFADDSHFSDVGTWTMARFLVERLRASGQLPRPSPSG